MILTGITVTKQPTKTSYYVGSTTLDIAGLEVTGTYNQYAATTVATYATWI